MTLRALRREDLVVTNEMLVSDAPWAQAMTLIPLRPRVRKSLPAMPGVCFIFSPTIATVARSCSAVIEDISPISSSFLNSFESTSTARSASAFLTPMVEEFSDEACDTMNTEMPLSARVEKMRLLTPITPTMPKPDTVTSEVSLIDEIPLMT